MDFQVSFLYNRTLLIICPGSFPADKNGGIAMKNVKKIDWQNYNVVFNDELKGYLVSKSHRKEIEEYEFI